MEQVFDSITMAKVAPTSQPEGWEVLALVWGAGFTRGGEWLHSRVYETKADAVAAYVKVIRYKLLDVND